MNHIRRYYFTCQSGNKYSLKLSYRREIIHGKWQVKYIFSKNSVTLFADNDFYCPLNDRNPVGIKSAYALLGFLTLRRGDTDREYFDNYTPEQIAFSESFDCEELQILVCDYEHRRG